MSVALSLGVGLRWNDVALDQLAARRTIAQKTGQAVASLHLRRQDTLKPYAYTASKRSNKECLVTQASQLQSNDSAFNSVYPTNI